MVDTELRAKAQQEASIAAKGQIESQIGTKLGNLVAVQEQYPDLKANENFLAVLGYSLGLSAGLRQAPRSG